MWCYGHRNFRGNYDCFLVLRWDQVMTLDELTHFMFHWWADWLFTETPCPFNLKELVNRPALRKDLGWGPSNTHKPPSDIRTQGWMGLNEAYNYESLIQPSGIWMTDTDWTFDIFFYRLTGLALLGCVREQAECLYTRMMKRFFFFLNRN